VPTYQYTCTACGHDLEALQSFSDEPLTQCPECQGRLRKRFGAVGVVFKGSGFYRTDSRTAAQNGANGSNDTSTGAKDSAGKKDSTGAEDSTGTKDSTGAKDSAGTKDKVSASATN
jgi:putative FmdB family regulatory protein